MDLLLPGAMKAVVVYETVLQIITLHDAIIAELILRRMPSGSTMSSFTGSQPLLCQPCENLRDVYFVRILELLAESRKNCYSNYLCLRLFPWFFEPTQSEYYVYHMIKLLENFSLMLQL